MTEVLGEATTPVAAGERRRRRRRVPVLVALLVAVGLLVLALLTPVAVRSPQSAGWSGSGTDLGAVVVYPDLARGHTDGDVDYPTTPPVGGPHDPEWLDCGAYDTPVRDENAVHDLEHGSVWITYDPSLGPADVARLARDLPANGIMSPYPGLPAPVVLTVWGAQLAVTGADDPRIETFLVAFGDGHTAPEPFASCEGGTPAEDGTTTTTV